MTNISVVIPAYNSAIYLTAAIDSALNQTLPPLEVIVVDDGSTDETLETLKHYGQRIRCILQENKGPATARNRGAAEAKGNLIAFLDADDVWLPEKLGEQAQVLSENPKIGLVHSDFQVLDFKTGEHSSPREPVGRFLGQCYQRFFLQGCGIHISTVIVRKECLEAVGGFDERIREASAEDYDLWIRLSRHFELGFVDRPLALYRLHSGNASKQRLAMLEAENYVLKKALRDDPELPKLLGKRVVRNRLFKLCFSIGYLHHDGLRSPEARAYLAQALRQRWANPYALTLYAANLLPPNLAQTLRSLKRQMARLVP